MAALFLLKRGLAVIVLPRFVGHFLIAFHGDVLCGLCGCDISLIPLPRILVPDDWKKNIIIGMIAVVVQNVFIWISGAWLF